MNRWLSEIAITGQIRSFHDPTRVKTASVISDGRASGSTMRQKICNREAPSKSPASSSSRGTERKNCLIRKTPKAVASHGMTSAARELSRCRRENITYVGIINSWIGIMIVPRMARKLMSRPRNRSRANP